MASIEESAQNGFVKAENYDQWRLSYPKEAVDALLSQAAVKDVQGARIVEVGAGTGIFTSILATRGEKYNIIAVEPHDDMRRVLEAKQLARVKVVKGTGEAMPTVEDSWADAVIVAQAFHWFATMEALKEIHRVMKPMAGLGMVWNREHYGTPLEQPNTTRWERRLKEIVWGRGNTEPRRRHCNALKIFDQQVNPSPFSSGNELFTLPLGEHITNWTHWLTKETICKKFLTISHISALPPEEHKEIEKLVYEAMDDDAELNDRNEVAVHGHTTVVYTKAIPSEPRSVSELN